MYFWPLLLWKCYINDNGFSNPTCVLPWYVLWIVSGYWPLLNSLPAEGKSHWQTGWGQWPDKPSWICPWSKDDGDGGDMWSCETCKAMVKLSPTYQRLTVYRPDPILSPKQQCQSTDGRKNHISWTCSRQARLKVFILVLITKGS